MSCLAKGDCSAESRYACTNDDDFKPHVFLCSGVTLKLNEKGTTQAVVCRGPNSRRYSFPDYPTPYFLVVRTCSPLLAYRRSNIRHPQLVVVVIVVFTLLANAHILLVSNLTLGRLYGVRLTIRHPKSLEADLCHCKSRIYMFGQGAEV